MRLAGVQLTRILFFAEENDAVISEGNAHGENFMYFIVHGELEIIQGGCCLCLLREADFFGELSLLRGTPRSATVRCRKRYVYSCLCLWVVI